MLMDDHNMPMQTVPTYHSLAVLYQRSKDNETGWKFQVKFSSYD